MDRLPHFVEFFEEDFIEDIQESKMSNLARQVAESNTLVDKALGSISTESHESGGSKTLDELGESLSELFGQLYEGSEVGNNSPWNKISESLGNLSSEIDRRDSLRNELKETQHRIDNVRLNLIEEIGEALGATTTALSSYDNDKLDRSFKWNLLQAGWIDEHLNCIRDKDRYETIKKISINFKFYSIITFFVFVRSKNFYFFIIC